MRITCCVLVPAAKSSDDASERTVTVKLRQRRIGTGAYSACYVRTGLKSPPLSVARREEDGVNGAAANRQCLYSADPTRVPKRISGIFKKKKIK